MYYDGKPCLIDLGREEYTARTFSPKRYEIWTMQSGYHNLPVINGQDQKEGKQFKAKNSSFRADGRSAEFTTDIAGAYTNEAMVKSWVRGYKLNRGKNFSLSDRYELAAKTEGVTSSNLITYCRVSEVRSGLLKFTGNGFSLTMSYDPKIVSPEIEFIPVNDRALKRYWPEGVTRVRLVFIKPGLKGGHTVVFTPEKAKK
jgi:hypothetical protein